MAVEIKEVIIRAVLEDEDDTGEGMEIDNGGSSSQIDGLSPEEMVELCVEQVLRILQRKNNR